ncbi:N-acetyl-gamma-glutamyl-phosphate reductase [Thalassotalea litorea]|uniref:N-acetyl-gamma-glutamyl-phosphate reductase n=1 Tax=Thalassotalea litorea TaxID=2020715 RepID=A0A5R9ICH7_9GAMM|nr:N-acetyl-gamma-glutamyl-phosphate reductase [Thalassotalea litorea]TLU61073.1 N-acetyl-gamma-glutamyl-phosphate reductase [Thalassotalea litorea]
MKIAVVGASGYVGAELIALLAKHPLIKEMHLLVSENSTSKDVAFSTLYPRFQATSKFSEQALQAFNGEWLAQNGAHLDAVFMATPHEYSQQWASAFLEQDIKVFDLSGAFRLNQPEDYPAYYGFEHNYPDLLDSAVYGLAEFNFDKIAKANLVAVPGCYPTASLLATKPITNANLQQKDVHIIVNGISGVSGAGRKASIASSFNEVSLTAYNVLQHRHQPEISQECGHPVIFNPHLAPFKRGLMATVTIHCQSHVTNEDVNKAYDQAYQTEQNAVVRVTQGWPKIDDVSNTPFANLHWQYDESKQILVVSCVIDNLLKGAASQAIQCFNLAMQQPVALSLVTPATIANAQTNTEVNA